MAHPSRRSYDNDPSIVENFAKCPRYDKHELDDDQIEEIAERAAVKAVEKATRDFYAGVGKSVMSKLYWLLGLIIVGTALWLQKNGLIKL